MVCCVLLLIRTSAVTPPQMALPLIFGHQVGLPTGESLRLGQRGRSATLLLRLTLDQRALYGRGHHHTHTHTPISQHTNPARLGARGWSHTHTHLARPATAAAPPPRAPAAAPVVRPPLPSREGLRRRTTPQCTLVACTHLGLLCLHRCGERRLRLRRAPTLLLRQRAQR
jgi:hypothetical protein